MNPKRDRAAAAPQGKPRLAYLVASGFGLGNLPMAPGTFGSLAGVVSFRVFQKLFAAPAANQYLRSTHFFISFDRFAEILLGVALAIAGVWAAGRVAKFSGQKDPPFVVIDEVSGQFLTYVLAMVSANWKYFLLGFILFRALDIWKPFPVRRAESLPGGLGIMADDWVAAIYAALGLWLAKAIRL